jgi:hypothetical protein
VRALPVTTLLGLLHSACGASSDASPQRAHLDAATPPYASELIAFEPGDAAGYGEDDLPDVVLGPPKGGGPGKGSLDVVSLGVGGEIVLGFGERAIIDGEGADFVVFENAFWAGGDPTMPFAEPGEVAVSEDGERWHTFDCDPNGRGGGSSGSGCAGLDPTLVYDTETTTKLDPEEVGGAAFDLEDLGVTRARFVRIRDLSDDGDPNSAGFDLDAIGLVHWEQTD